MSNSFQKTLWKLLESTEISNLPQQKDKVAI